MSTVRANAFVDSAGGNTATINGAYIRPGAIDPENRIINGSFDFWQRGTSFTSSTYGADRWINGVIGGTVTTTRQSFSLGDTFGPNNPTFFLRQTVSGQTLASHNAQIQHRIESVRSYAGQTITLIGWARRSSGSGNMAVEFSQVFGTGGSPSAVVDVAPVSVPLTGSWAPFAVTVNIPSISGKTLGTNGDDYLRINFWTSAGSDFNARTNSLGLQAIGVDLWGIHIKVGTHTTAAVDLYSQPELQQELLRCQRYYVRWQGEAVANGFPVVGMGNINTGGTSAGIVIPTSSAMRGNPAFSFSGTVNVFDGAAGAAVTGFSNSYIRSPNSIWVTVTLNTALTVGRGALMYPSNASTNWFAADAEL